MTGVTRCRWCQTKNPLYVRYHDSEWGVPTHNDAVLFEFLVLEPFQAGLAWETVLNKRAAFSAAFAAFDAEAVAQFDADTVDTLLQKAAIIRHRGKIEAAIHNASVFLQIQKEWGSFDAYVWHFTQEQVVYETGHSVSPLSDTVAADLKRRGMKRLGSTTVYAYLQAIGVIHSHDVDCFLYREK